MLLFNFKTDDLALELKVFLQNSLQIIEYNNCKEESISNPRFLISTA